MRCKLNVTASALLTVAHPMVYASTIMFDGDVQESGQLHVRFTFFSHYSSAEFCVKRLRKVRNGQEGRIKPSEFSIEPFEADGTAGQ
mmetsp:Transcript_15808/g.40740  ORF Transcript_15808/g.40740 Transcript_15808/m.40740 type:complete len:87 (-) Transcript_15808:1183-1443(-)